MSYIPKRIPHIMKAIKTISAPSNLLFFDTETKGQIYAAKKSIVRHSLWFGYTSAFRYESGKRTREVSTIFHTIKDFWRFLKKRLDPSRPLYVFAHNIGFDLTIVDFWLQSELPKWEVNNPVLEDPPTFIDCTYDGKRVIFVDTLNYWRASLSSLGKSFGLAKLKMPDWGADLTQWYSYCSRDVEILELAITGLIDYLINNNLGTLNMTAPAIAMSVYKHRFLKHDIYIHDNLYALDIERGSYYGGLVNCYFIGQAKRATVYHLDVNSLYPSVMLADYPCKLLDVCHNESLLDLAKRLKKHGAGAIVVLDTTKNTYPYKYKNKLLDVSGQFTTYLCGAELIAALKSGDIVSCNTVAYYDLAPIFKDFINYFWQERQKYKAKNDEIKQLFCKLLMNSLYGKFGQRGYDWKDLDSFTLAKVYADNNLDFPEVYKSDNWQPTIEYSQNKFWPLGLDEPISIRKTGRKLQTRIVVGEHHASMPIIAGYVTSYARQRLRQLIKIAGPKQCYYCDTDSLFVTKLGQKRLSLAGEVSQSELGKLKFEGEAFEPNFHGPKDYSFGDKTVIKGIRLDAIEIADGEYMQNQFEGLRSVLARRPDPFIEIRWIIKLNRRLFNKGMIGKDGWVKPFNIPYDLPE